MAVCIEFEFMSSWWQVIRVCFYSLRLYDSPAINTKRDLFLDTNFLYTVRKMPLDPASPSGTSHSHSLSDSLNTPKPKIKARWTQEDDNTLCNLVIAQKQNGERLDWENIASRLGGKHSAGACRARSYEKEFNKLFKTLNQRAISAENYIAHHPMHQNVQLESTHEVAMNDPVFPNTFCQNTAVLFARIQNEIVQKAIAENKLPQRVTVVSDFPYFGYIIGQYGSQQGSGGPIYLLHHKFRELP